MRGITSILHFLAFATFLNTSPTSASDLFYSQWYNLGIHGFNPRQWYKSFPLGAPLANVVQWDEQCGDGYTLISPRGGMISHPGPVILDGWGHLVWMEDSYGQITDFKTQSYKGQEYLTFWAGENGGDHSYGMGIYYMLDSSYRVYKTIEPAGNLKGDLHEFKITEEGTALMTVYNHIPADISTIGGPSEGWILDSSFQEIDIDSGHLLFEWRASDHYRVDETMRKMAGGNSPDNAFDFFHINSIDKDQEGNYYISSRYTHTITCVSSAGDILWILGGKQNRFKDLSDGRATNFMWQHHATMHNTTMTIFDNARVEREKAKNSGGLADRSRAILVDLDVVNMTVRLVQEYVHPQHTIARSQGSAQLIESTGNMLVGWGFEPSYTEFTPDGMVICDVQFAPSFIWNTGWATSYRVFRTISWVGMPGDSPDVHMKPSGNLYVSWNGATEVDHWVLQGADYAGVTERVFTEVLILERVDFETMFKIETSMPEYLRVQAVDRTGNVLGVSRIVSRETDPRRKLRYILLCALMAVMTFVAIFFRREIARIVKARWKHRRLRWRNGIQNDRKTAMDHELQPLHAD